MQTKARDVMTTTFFSLVAGSVTGIAVALTLAVLVLLLGSP